MKLKIKIEYKLDLQNNYDEPAINEAAQSIAQFGYDAILNPLNLDHELDETYELMDEMVDLVPRDEVGNPIEGKPLNFIKINTEIIS